MKRTPILLFGLFVFAPALHADAAALSAYASPVVVAAGDTVSVRIAVDAGGVPINSAEGVLHFPPDVFSVSSVSKGGSIFTIWVEEPAYSNAAGTVSFSGGLPNPGYAGSAGTVLTVLLTAKRAGTASLSFTGAAVRANDGSGTDVLASASGSTISVRSAVAPQATPEAAPSSSPTGPQVAKLGSPTHPSENAWYAERTALISWSLPVGTDAVQLVLDRTKDAPPVVTYEPPITEKRVTDLEDGTWYFRIRAKDGAWGTARTYELNIDGTPPMLAASEFSYDETSRSLVVALDARDAASGIQSYEIAIDGGEPETLPDDAFATGTYRMPFLSSGAHHAVVRAIDRAGNASEVEGTFSVPRTVLETPIWSVAGMPITPIGVMAASLLMALAALAIAIAALLRGRGIFSRGLERDVHRGFSLYRGELVKGLKLLERARARRDLTAEEVKLHKSMIQNLGDLERYIGELLRKPK